MKICELFAPQSILHPALFPADEVAWYPLCQLKKYMQNYEYPHYKELPTDGTPLAQTLVLYQGKILTADEVEIVFGDATKGDLIVSKAGEKMMGASVLMAGSVFLGSNIVIGEGVLIESGALIKSPTILGDNCEVRQGAYLRGYCLAGKRCVLGHTTEIKHSVFLDDAKAGHFAYLGDSILGADANLGAGTKFANLRFLAGNVCITIDGKKIDTGLRKFGAILGDGAQTGCNSVTNPGTIMGQKAMLFPNTTARGGVYKKKAVIR